MKEGTHTIFSFSESKERIDTLINSLHIGVLVQGPGSEILFCNNAALKMLGFSWEELNGRSSFTDCDIIHEDGSLFLPSDHPVSRVMADKKSAASIIMGVYRRATNDRVWLQVNAEPLLDDNGNVKEVISSFSDITERKAIEEKLTGLYQSLESRAFELATSTADLKRFVYVATHDLQEPLRIMTSFTQLLKRRYEKQLDDQAVEYINYAVESASRMKKLILDLLEYSQFSNNNEEFVQTEMNKVVQNVTALFSKQIEELKAQLIVSELPVINAKTLLMQQLFEKLISNALKYRNGCNPVIKIDCKENEGHFIFSVSDNGIGIDPKYSDKVFILFQRLHSEKDAQQGTGVGLAISKKIVELHRGDIWVRSEKGEGSTFYFTIPKQQKRA